MKTTRHGTTHRRESRRQALGRCAVTLACSVALAGCSSLAERSAGEDGQPSASTLNRVANAALSSGNAHVRLIDGVAYVTGNVETALDERAVVRALSAVDGVERVESRLLRDM